MIILLLLLALVMPAWATEEPNLVEAVAMFCDTPEQARAFVDIITKDKIADPNEGQKRVNSQFYNNACVLMHARFKILSEQVGDAIQVSIGTVSVQELLMVEVLQRNGEWKKVEPPSKQYAPALEASTPI